MNLADEERARAVVVSSACRVHVFLQSIMHLVSQDDSFKREHLLRAVQRAIWWDDFLARSLPALSLHMQGPKAGRSRCRPVMCETTWPCS